VDGAKPGLANRLLISTPDEGRDAVHFLKRMNVDFIKVHTGVPREAYMALMEEANREGMAVVGHVPLAVTAAAASDAGQRMIEHMSSLAEPRTIQLVETE
jgi:ketopantoate hydroxymethyltransferase